MWPFLMWKIAVTFSEMYWRSVQTHWIRDEQPRLWVASNWRNRLGVGLTEQNIGAIKRAYRTKAQQLHPDHGGDHDAMSQLNEAYAQAKQELHFV